MDNKREKKNQKPQYPCPLLCVCATCPFLEEELSKRRRRKSSRKSETRKERQDKDDDEDNKEEKQFTQPAAITTSAPTSKPTCELSVFVMLACFFLSFVHVVFHLSSPCLSFSLALPSSLLHKPEHA